MLVTTDSKSQYVYPFLGKAVIGRASYLDNLFGKNKKLIGFGIGAAPRAQIQGLFVFTKGVIEIISILVSDKEFIDFFRRAPSSDSGHAVMSASSCLASDVCYSTFFVHSRVHHLR